MKIVVFSDSHGNIDWMIAVVEAEKPDRIFFLGDHERDGWEIGKLYPEIPLHAVKGNCDWSGGMEEWVIEVEQVRFLLTHGHLYGVKTGLSRLAEAGERYCADVVCFGHTHSPLMDCLIREIRLFNPGTIGGPHGQRRTYGVLLVKNGTITEEIKDTDQI